MWRIYSEMPRKPNARNEISDFEGVRPKLRPQKLIDALTSGLGGCFIAPVKYMELQALTQELANIIGGDRVADFCGVNAHASSLLLKRDEFRHEHEVRLLYVDKHRKYAAQDLLPCPIDANALIEEITIDPRLDWDQGETRIRAIEDLGFKGRISRSTLFLRRSYCR